VQIAFLVYEGMTALDIMGPYEVLARLPEVDARFVAKQPEVTVDTGVFSVGTRYGLADAPHPDVFVLPGGTKGTFAAAADPEILDWVREAHAHSTFSTSVCTGSLILAAAGLLEGLEATTHWAARSLLENYGVKYSEQRVVRQGKIVTAAGVSSGIDMALYLASELVGEQMAKSLQLGIEYDPQPPFDAGSPSKAGPELVELALTELAKSY